MYVEAIFPAPDDEKHLLQSQHTRSAASVRC
jgi:hypothetical protein